jgi:hypothetical protein
MEVIDPFVEVAGHFVEIEEGGVEVERVANPSAPLSRDPAGRNDR